MNRIEQCFGIELIETASWVTAAEHPTRALDYDTLQDALASHENRLARANHEAEYGQNVKKRQQAEKLARKIQSEISALCQDIDMYGADGWVCSCCDQTFTIHEECDSDNVCDSCLNEWDDDTTE